MSFTTDANGKAVELNYSTLESPYDDYLSRTQSDAFSVSGGISSENTVSSNESSSNTITSGAEIKDLFLSNVMRSTNYLPKTRGFMIDAKSGVIEASNLTLTGGSISYQKTSFTDTANAGYYIGPEGIYFGGALDTTKLKFNIATGSLEYAGNLINASGAVVLNSTAQTILKDFSFGTTDYAGAVRTGDITWNGSGVVTSGTGVAIYRGGIVGASSGVVTFAIDAVTGDASFSGTITGSTITGGILQTASSGARALITSADIGTDFQANSIGLYDRTGHVMFSVGTTNAAFGDRAVMFLDLDSSYTGDQQKGLSISRNLAVSASEYLLHLNETSASAASQVARIDNAGLGDTLNIITSGEGKGIYIVNNGTDNGLRIDSGSSSDRSIYVVHSAASQAVTIEHTNNDMTASAAALRISRFAASGTAHFRPIININSDANTIWYAADATDPNGNLTGTDGDFCLRSGNPPAYCTGGTSWTSL